MAGSSLLAGGHRYFDVAIYQPLENEITMVGGGGTKGVRKAESGYQGRVINSAPNIYIGHA